MLVANKCDIKSEKGNCLIDRGKELAKSLGIRFFECSAKDGTNIEELFESLVLMIMEQREEFPLAATWETGGPSELTINKIPVVIEKGKNCPLTIGLRNGCSHDSPVIDDNDVELDF